MAKFANVTDLPAAPFFERAVLIDPTPTAVGLAVLGVVALLIFRRTERSSLGVGALAAALAAAIGVLVAGAVVETERELLAAKTARYIELAAAGDADGVSQMLGERVGLAMAGEEATQDRAWLLSFVEGLDEVVLETWQRPRGVELRGANVGVTRVSVRNRLEGWTGDRFASTWDLHWVRDEAGGWRIVRFECLSVLGQRPERGWFSQAMRFVGGRER